MRVAGTRSARHTVAVTRACALLLLLTTPLVACGGTPPSATTPPPAREVPDDIANAPDLIPDRPIAVNAVASEETITFALAARSRDSLGWDREPSVALSETFSGGELPRPSLRAPLAARYRFELPNLRSTATQDEDGYFVTPAAHDLFVYGDFDVRDVVVGDGRVHLMARGFDAGELAPIVALISRSLSSSQERIGAAHGAHLLLLERGPPSVTREAGLTRLTTDRVITSALNTEEARVIIEAAHGVYLGTDSALVARGFGRWLALRAIAELSGEEGGVSIVDVMESYRAYRLWAVKGARPIEGTSDALAAHAGTVAAFCVDTKLREEGRSIDELIGQANQNARGETQRVNGAAVLTSLMSTAARRELFRVARFRGVTVFQSCLERAGASLRARDFQGFSRTGLAQTFGARNVSDTLTILDAGPGPLEIQDQVLTVRGVPVRSRGDVSLLLADLPPGAPFSVEVRRGARDARVGLQIPAAAERERVVVTFAHF